jgi:hypothetical protein
MTTIFPFLMADFPTIFGLLSPRHEIELFSIIRLFA